MSDPMHICNSMMSHSYTNAVHNLPQYFQYAKGHAHAKHASASLPPQQRQDQQYFKPVSPSRNKPSSLNTQLYTAENFMKISSPRRGCYIYNSNNEISTANNSESETKEPNGDMEVDDTNSSTNLLTVTVQQNFCHNNYKSQQQRVTKRKQFHDENSNLFVEEYPNLKKRQRRLVVPNFGNNYNDQTNHVHITDTARNNNIMQLGVFN